MEINYLQYVPIATHSDIFGHEMDDTKFEHMLSIIECQKALLILSHLSTLHNAICYSNNEAIILELKLRVIHSKHISELGGNWLKYNQFKSIMSSQSIFLLEKLVLIHCPMANQINPTTLDDFILIMDALLVINDMLPKDDVRGHETEYLYLTLYHNTHKVVKNQLARAFYIFSTVAKKDQETTDF